MRTAPGFWARSAFTTWNTSTTPSVLQRSMVVAMEQNIPERQTVSLYSVRKGVKCHGSLTQTTYAQKNGADEHVVLITQTVYFPYRSQVRCPCALPETCLYRSGYRGAAYLQWMAMGWFPVLRCTLPTSSMVSVTVLRLLQWPLGAQLTMWSCVFCWAFPDWGEGGGVAYEPRT